MSEISKKPYRPFGPETFSALALVMFSVPALIFSVFLTVLKFRSEYRCDGFLQNSCTSGCSTALSDSLSEIWGIPLSVYSTAYYFVLMLLAVVVGLWPRHFAPVARFPVLVLAIAGLGCSIALGLYAWIELGAICEYCAFLYLSSLGVFWAAWLLNPDGPILGLITGVRRLTGVSVMIILVLASAFSAVVLLQKRQLSTQIAGVLRAPGGLSCAEQRLEQLPETRFTLASNGSPQVIIAVFIDLACPHCKKDFEFWRGYQRDHSDSLQVEFFHFSADTACGPLDSPPLRRNQSCNAALAAQCMDELLPGRGVDHLERLFAMQSLDEPDFSQEHLADLGVPGLRECMNQDAVRMQVRRHILFGMSKKLTAPPSALLVPMVQRGRQNRPLGRALVFEGGEKSRDYVDAAVHEVQSWKEQHE